MKQGKKPDHVKRLSNPYAKALSHAMFAQKKPKAKKGKGSYKRRPKHIAGAAFDFSAYRYTLVV